tara:strand:+ start:2654 stop:2836 length:183 start_codon:yes stop_codon:yes gene_type:complete
MKIKHLPAIGVLTIILSSSLFYLGASNHRLSDTNDALSADINLLIESIQYATPQEPQIIW